MRSSLRILITLPLLLAAWSCAEDLSEPLAVYQQFQKALLIEDRAALRKLVSESSRKYVESLPRPKPGSRPRVVGARREHSRVYIDVEDDNPKAEIPCGTFVVVKEDGEWLVDLIQTAKQNLEQVPGPARRNRVIPTEVPRTATGNRGTGKPAESVSHRGGR